MDRATIQPEELLAAGYRKFRNEAEAARMQESYIASYQKRFDDEHGQKYFIEFNHNRLRFPNGIDLESMAASTQFGTRFQIGKAHETTFNVEMLNGRETLAEVEAFFEDMWQKLGLRYYRRNEE